MGRWDFVKRSRFGRRPKLRRLKDKSVEDEPKIHWFTKSEVALLRESACWNCGFLMYCGECKRLECASVRSRRVPVKVCSLRESAEVE